MLQFKTGSTRGRSVSDKQLSRGVNYDHYNIYMVGPLTVRSGDGHILLETVEQCS